MLPELEELTCNGTKKIVKRHSFDTILTRHGGSEVTWSPRRKEEGKEDKKGREGKDERSRGKGKRQSGVGREEIGKGKVQEVHVSLGGDKNET